MLTLGELMKQQSHLLEKAGVPNPDSEIQWIVAEATRFNRVQVALNRDYVLSPQTEKAVTDMVARRCTREPLQYIIGNQSFMNIKLKCDRRALIPRPETELLAEQCINLIRRGYPRFSPFTLLDIGTGTGALALGIAKAATNVHATAVDISADALALAAENAQLCGLQERVTMVLSDIYSGVMEQRFNGIVSNPPYVPTKAVPELMPEVSQFEPWLALDGGQYGLDFYYRIITDAPAHLLPGGFLALEAEHFEFDYIRERIEKTGVFEPAVLVADYTGRHILCYTKLIQSD